MQNNFGQKNEVGDYRLLIINCRLNTVGRERWKKGVEPFREEGDECSAGRSTVASLLDYSRKEDRHCRVD